MTLKEFYDVTGGDYDEVLRGLGKETRIYKYLAKLPGTGVLDSISSALEAKDYETAFREAHNLKGMSLNVGIKSLQAVSSDLTESLRNGPTGDVQGLFEKTAEEYKKCCSLIEQIDPVE